jgi:hypothetical protein
MTSRDVRGVIRQLVDFQRLHLKAKESCRIALSVDRSQVLRSVNKVFGNGWHPQDQRWRRPVDVEIDCRSLHREGYDSRLIEISCQPGVMTGYGQFRVATPRDAIAPRGLRTGRADQRRRVCYSVGVFFQIAGVEGAFGFGDIQQSRVELNKCRVYGPMVRMA